MQHTKVEPISSEIELVARDAGGDVERNQAPAPQQAGLTVGLALSVFSIVFGSAFLYGYHEGVVNSPFDVMNDFLNKTTTTLEPDPQEHQHKLDTYWSLIISLYLAGGVIGSTWLPEFMSEKYGKKVALIFASLIGMAGSVICFISPYVNSFIPLIVGRTIVGIQTGISMVLSPALLVELAPLHLRGACGSVIEPAIFSGIFVSNIVGLRQLFGTEYLWHILFLIPAAILIVHSILLLFCAQSPRWLIDRNRDDEAIAALNFLRGKSKQDVIQAEFQEMKHTSMLDEREITQSFKFWDLFKTRRFRWPMIISINLHAAAQLTGIAAAAFYSSSVMARAGLSPETAKFANLGGTAFGVLAAFLSIILVDRIGRKPLVLLGFGGMVLADILLTVALVSGQYNISIPGFAIFLFSLAVGPGPISFLTASELFPQIARPLALSVCIAVNWASNMTVGLVFPHMLIYLGEYAFVPFGLLALIEFWFHLVFMPETTDVPLEVTAALFEPGKPLIQFKPLRLFLERLGK